MSHHCVLDSLKLKAYVITWERFEVQWHARLWHRVVLIDDYGDDLSRCEPCLSTYVGSISSYWNICSPQLQQQVRNSQLLRKCHNLSLFFAFSFRIRKYFFLHDRNISCDKIAFIMQQSGYFFLFSFYSFFALDISSTTVQFTPHRMAFFSYYKMTIMWDRKRNEMLWVHFGCLMMMYGG